MASAENAREKQADEGEQGESKRHLAREHLGLREQQTQEKSRDRRDDEYEK